MAAFPPLWADARLPERYEGMDCQELILEYQRSHDRRIVVYLIQSNDGPRRRLTAILYRILKQRSRIEDFFQTLFLDLEKKLLDVGPIRNCAAWFAQVVRNKAINEWNRENRRPEVEAAGQPSGNGQLHTEDHLARRIDAKATLKRMEQAVAAIEEGWTCVCLKWSGKRYTECAEALGITFTQFRGRYQRAHNILSKEFGADYEKFMDWAKMEVS